MAADDRSESSIRFDLFELNPTSCLLRRSGVVVDLPRQAVTLLALLAARPNILVTRKEIKDALWPGESHGDFDSRLNFAVKKLREALGDSAEQPRYVQTVRNAGYLFIAPVRLAHDVTSTKDDNLDGSVVPALVERNTATSSLPSRGFRFGLSPILIAVIAVVGSAVAFGGFVLRPHAANPSVQTDGTRSVPTSGEGVPQISSVSPILPQARQRVVIRGRGFGLHTGYANTDSPFLAIGDLTRDWAAGRIIPHNWDEVMLDVESWDDQKIVISGFSGDYGQKGWTLNPGDQLEVRVWNPQTGTGPAKFQARVGSRPDASRRH